MVCPVMKRPASEARNTAAPAISSGSPMRRSGGRGLGRAQTLRIVPQRLGEIGLDQAGRDAVHADAVLAELDREIAGELHVGSLRDVVGADHRRAHQSADRRDDDDRSVLALDHARRDELHQPMVGDDVIVEDLAELLVGDAAERPVIRVRRGVADEDVDRPDRLLRRLDQLGEVRLRRDRRGDRHRLARAAGRLDPRAPQPRRRRSCATRSPRGRPARPCAWRSPCRCRARSR